MRSLGILVYVPDVCEMASHSFEQLEQVVHHESYWTKVAVAYKEDSADATSVYHKI
jgi:hypothetical protein